MNDDSNEDPSDGFNFDLQECFYKMTIDSTSAIVFGIELCSLGSDKQHDFPLAFD